MKVMSFNTQHCLNYLTKKIDFEIMADAIVKCNADIVALNEMRGLGTNPHYTAQTEMLAKLTGMKYFYFAKAIDVRDKGPYGNALLSKIPIVEAEIIPIPDPDLKIYRGHYETRCVLKIRLEGDITVLVTHFGLNPDEQVNAVRTVLNCISTKKCVLMGDFNAAPSDRILRPLFDRMIDTADSFDSPKLSFPSDAPREKIDYIFVSSDVNVISADIPAIVASDHRPHVAEIEF